MSSSQPEPQPQSASSSSSPRKPRRQRGTRETLIAIVLGFEAIVVGLGALTMLGLKALDFLQALVGGGLVILILVAAVVWARFTAGLVLGWLAQAIILASGFIAGAMFVVGVVFTAIWVFALVQGARIDRANNSHNDRNATGEDNAR